LTGLSHDEGPKTEEITEQPEEHKDVVEQLTSGGRTIDLSNVVEGDLGESTQESGDR